MGVQASAFVAKFQVPTRATIEPI